MQLRRLRLVNFRQHADTTIEFDQGLTGIVGPNGAGKSTLLEAIAWAMYGTQAARGTRDSIRRRSAPPRSRVEVELDFLLGAHRYRVTRSLDRAALHQDGDATPVANSSGAVTDKVTRLLGMTNEEFLNTYFTGQKQLAVLANASTPERARFLSRVLGYERLATVQTRLKEERSALRASLATAEIGLVDPAALAEEERVAAIRIEAAETGSTSARATRDAAVTAAAAIAPRWEAIQRRREAVQQLETDLNIAEHAAEQAKVAFATLDRDLTDALDAKTRRDELLPELADWDTLVADRIRLDGLALAFSGRRALEAQVAEVRKSVAALEKRLAELPGAADLEASRAELAVAQELTQRATRGHEEQRTLWIQEREHATTRRGALEEQLKETREQVALLKSAGDKGVCPTCGKPLGKEREAVLEDLESRLSVIVADGKHFRARMIQLAAEPEPVVSARKVLAEAEAEVKRITAQVTRLEVGLKDRARTEQTRAEAATRLAALESQLAQAPTSYDEAEHRRIRERVAALEPLREQVTRLTVRAERAVELIPKAAEAEQHQSRLESRAAELRAKLAESGWSATEYETVRAAFQAAERDRHAAEIAVARAEAELGAAREHRAAVARRREEREARARELARLELELLYNEELNRAYGDLREELNNGLKPDLADAASTLIQDLTDGRYAELELDDDYRPVLIDDGEPKPVISGGEEDIANLALRLAVSQMIADRAGQPFSLLILDEVFGSLDEERRAAVVDLLRGLADRFPQVILITHIESVRDGFDRIVRIDYDVEQGIASAREEQPAPIEAPHAAA